MQRDLRTNHPDLQIQILGMNQLGHEGGNPSITDGRDLPWLQDVDADQNGSSDVWLNSWPFAYRDVVILDAENRVLSRYNLTSNDLRVAANYDELKQLFLDAAGESAATPLNNDFLEMPPGAVSDILVLRNDPVGANGNWTLESFQPPAQGTAELVTISYPTDLNPQEWPAPTLVISEIRPGEAIELFNGSYQPLALDDVNWQLVAGSQRRAISAMASGQVVNARGYVELAWPAEFAGSDGGGELLLYGQPGADLNDPNQVRDFVAWGTPLAGSRIELARGSGRWSGDPAPALAQGSIQRRVATFGQSASDYETQTAPTPAAAPDGASVSHPAIRYTAPADFAGEVSFGYTARDPMGIAGTASVTIDVLPAAHPWRNAADSLDVDANGLRAPNDALLIINLLNRGLQGQLPVSRVSLLATLPYVDSNGSNSIEPADLLRIINGLNSGVPAEGEASAVMPGFEVAPGFPVVPGFQAANNTPVNDLYLTGPNVQMVPGFQPGLDTPEVRLHGNRTGQRPSTAARPGTWSDELLLAELVDAVWEDELS
ncbi:MAG: hypothetical protein J5I93_22840 [Pirellulaceae bacterium]|nr:hypothetical protein [Pirellulaceae bacterium]